MVHGTGSKKKHKVNFTINLAGNCREISKLDLCDVFAAPGLTTSTSKLTLPQIINFAPVDANSKRDGSSQDRPLTQDIPEGAKLLSVLASDRHKDNFIRFVDVADPAREASRQ